MGVVGKEVVAIESWLSFWDQRLSPRMEVVMIGRGAPTKLLVDEVGPSRQHRQMLEAIVSMDHAF